MITSSILLGITTFAYLLCALLYLSGVIFRRRTIMLWGTVTGAAALAVQMAGIILRWWESYQIGYGHAPLSNLYESLVFAAWAIMLIYLIMEHRTKQRALGVFPALFAFLAMAYASFSTGVNSKIQPLLPALKSNWLIAHVVTCFIGYAAFAVSFGPEVFGDQPIVDDEGNILEFEERLLLNSIDLSLEEIKRRVEGHGGMVIPSHFDKGSFSLISQLGLIPEDMELEVLEASHRTHFPSMGNVSPHIPRIVSSDAHRLEDIGNARTIFLLAEATLAELRLAFRGQEGRKIVRGWKRGNFTVSRL